MEAEKTARANRSSCEQAHKELDAIKQTLSMQSGLDDARRKIEKLQEALQVNIKAHKTTEAELAAGRAELTTAQTSFETYEAVEAELAALRAELRTAYDRWLSWNLACCESLEDRTPPHLEILRHDKWTGIELLWISLVGDSAAAVDLLALIGHILVDRKNRQQLAHEEAALLLGSLEIAIMAASKWPIAEQTPFDELQNALVLLRIVKLLLRSGTDFNHLETIKTHSYDICEALNRLDINFAAVYFNVLSRCTQLETFEDRGASTISGLTASMHLVASTTCNIGFDKGGIAMISHHIPDEPMSIALYSASDMEYKMHFDEIELRFLMSRRSGDVRQHLQDPITFDFNEPDIMLFFWTEFEDKMRLVADNRMTTDGLASRNACVISHPSETRP